MNEGRDSQQGSAKVDRGLHDIGPDHGRQPALEGVDQSQQRDDRDGRDLSRAQRNRHNN